mgnify:CR=1 FL=1|tara:strand:+ start:3399 stop:3584 length:186 start_codon:yes stop_codon:yes gene_type:complete
MDDKNNSTPEILPKPPIHPNNFHDVNHISSNLQDEILKLAPTVLENPEKTSKNITNIIKTI